MQNWQNRPRSSDTLQSSRTDQSGPAGQSGDPYARIARVYDPATRLLLAPMRRAAACVFQDMGARRVVDICCGTGAQAAGLLDRGAIAGLRVVGVDASRAMLAQAPQRKGLNLVQAAAQRLPLADGCADGAILAFALHENTPELRLAMLDEAARILTPEGRLLLIEHLMPARRAVPRGRRLLRGATLLGARAVERSAGRSHYAMYDEFLRSGALEALIERAGLATERLIPFYFATVGLAIARPACATEGGAGPGPYPGPLTNR